jgi:hypothetical protein
MAQLVLANKKANVLVDQLGMEQLVFLQQVQYVQTDINKKEIHVLHKLQLYVQMAILLMDNIVKHLLVLFVQVDTTLMEQNVVLQLL